MNNERFNIVTMGSRNSMQCRVVLRLCVLALLAFLAVGDGEDEFGYDNNKPDGPQHWGDLHPEWTMCKDGREQSPINVHTRKRRIDTHLTTLNTSYVPSHAVVFHDGHAIEVDVVDGNAGHFLLEGEDYLLQQFHFHSPSEHIIDGVRRPLEMHMVHRTADGQKIAVIGVGFKSGPPSPFLDEFWDKLGMLTGVGVRVDIGTLVVDEPHLKLGPTYARYHGSLTTPPCTQNITWTISLHQEGNTISSKQLEAFRKVLPKPSNRPIQNLHGRSVTFPRFRPPTHRQGDQV